MQRIIINRVNDLRYFFVLIRDFLSAVERYSRVTVSLLPYIFFLKILISVKIIPRYPPRSTIFITDKVCEKMGKLKNNFILFKK
jgi:hypothetical protein